MMYDDLIEQMRSRASWLEFAIIKTPSKTDGNGDAILFRKAADAIEDLQKQLHKSEADNTNLTGWLAEEYAKKCPHYIRNVHVRGDDSLCDKWVCEIKSLPKWIPVTERLPEEYEQVLTCDELGNIHIMYHTKIYAYPFNISPTHPRYFMPKWWMPLPEPPESENE